MSVLPNELNGCCALLVLFSLTLKTVAEGVERDDVRALLLELGCDEAQGCYFSEPLVVGASDTYWRRLE